MLILLCLTTFCDLPAACFNVVSDDSTNALLLLVYTGDSGNKYAIEAHQADYFKVPTNSIPDSQLPGVWVYSGCSVSVYCMLSRAKNAMYELQWS